MGRASRSAAYPYIIGPPLSGFRHLRLSQTIYIDAHPLLNIEHPRTLNVFRQRDTNDAESMDGREAG